MIYKSIRLDSEVVKLTPILVKHDMGYEEYIKSFLIPTEEGGYVTLLLPDGTFNPIADLDTIFENCTPGLLVYLVPDSPGRLVTPDNTANPTALETPLFLLTKNNRFITHHNTKTVGNYFDTLSFESSYLITTIQDLLFKYSNVILTLESDASEVEITKALLIPNGVGVNIHIRPEVTFTRKSGFINASFLKLTFDNDVVISNRSVGFISMADTITEYDRVEIFSTAPRTMVLNGRLLDSSVKVQSSFRNLTLTSNKPDSLVRNLSCITGKQSYVFY